MHKLLSVLKNRPKYRMNERTKAMLLKPSKLDLAKATNVFELSYLSAVPSRYR